MSKLEKFFNDWFDGCGLTSIERITEAVFPPYSDMDERLILARNKWDNFSLRLKRIYYESAGFKDHLYNSEREFILGYCKKPTNTIRSEPW